MVRKPSASFNRDHQMTPEEIAEYHRKMQELRAERTSLETPPTQKEDEK